LLSLQHPHIVSCYAIEHNRGNRYLVMEYCEAGTLRELLNHSGGLTPLQGIKLILDTLQGLGHAHKSNIIHCDLKPENVLLRLTSKGWQAKVSDFGVAKLAQEIGEVSNNTGSPGYMAPERFYGEFSIASDLYAIGVMLYEVLLGKRPFSGKPSELMVAHINQRVHIPDTLPMALRKVVAKSLEKLPGKRFTSAQAMQEAIIAALKSGEVNKEQLSQVLAFAEADSLDTGSLAPAYPVAIALDPISQQITTDGAFKAWLQKIPAQITGLGQIPSLILDSEYEEALTNKTNNENNKANQSLTNQSLQHKYSHQPIAICTAIANQIWIEAIDAEAINPKIINSATNLETNSDTSANKITRAIEKLASKLTNQAKTATISLEQPIRDLAVCGDRLFIFTDRQIQMLTYPFSDRQANANATPELIYTSSDLIKPPITTISPHADWLAVAQGSKLEIKNLVNDRAFNLDFAAGSTVAVIISQIVAFDRHHLAVFMQRADRESTQIALVSRRGNLMWKYPLPTRIERAIATNSANTNSKLVLVEANTNNLCLVELFPYRVNRLLLGYKPEAIVPTNWGFMIAADLGNGQSNLNLLDLFGQRVGQLTVTGKVLKIVAVNVHTFMILTSIEPEHTNHEESTQSEPASNIYLVDLKQLAVDIIF
jgi:serine/threonine protein kinase